MTERNLLIKFIYLCKLQWKESSDGLGISLGASEENENRK